MRLLTYNDLLQQGNTSRQLRPQRQLHRRSLNNFTVQQRAPSQPGRDEHRRRHIKRRCNRAMQS